MFPSPTSCDDLCRSDAWYVRKCLTCALTTNPLIASVSSLSKRDGICSKPCRCVIGIRSDTAITSRAECARVVHITAACMQGESIIALPCTQSLDEDSPRLVRSLATAEHQSLERCTCSGLSRCVSVVNMIEALPRDHGTTSRHTDRNRDGCTLHCERVPVWR